jgi:hypothetical protein
LNKSEVLRLEKRNFILGKISTKFYFVDTIKPFPSHENCSLTKLQKPLEEGDPKETGI